eukprot:GHVN01015221.1.p1 GENE.GHVN01015221.1~~GHVN01015221.1.p1  ORF type:complete len:365 (+),score=70.67 GHVN01015221.1:48-1142(+)
MTETIRLKIKSLSNESWDIDIETTATVAALKDKLGGDETRNLIHLGKVLADDQVIGDITKIRETSLIISQKIRSKKPETPSPQAASSATSAPPPPVPTPGTETPTTTPPVPTAAAPAAATTAEGGGLNEEAAKSSFVVGPELEEKVASIVAMGFDEPLARKALKAAFFCPDRAVEYLVNGHPLDEPAQPSPEEAATAGDLQGDGGSPLDPSRIAEVEELARREDFATLRNDPLMQQCRQWIQTTPQMLPQLLTVLTQHFPTLAQALASNPQLVNDLLMASDEHEDDGQPNLQAGEEGVALNLSEEEFAAVKRLEDLGFNRIAAAQAYLAFEKNEEAAANYLFDNMDADDTNMGEQDTTGQGQGQ